MGKMKDLYMGLIEQNQNDIESFFEEPTTNTARIKVGYWFAHIDLVHEIPTVEDEWEECYANILGFSTIDNDQHRTCINKFATY